MNETQDAVPLLVHIVEIALIVVPVLFIAYVLWKHYSINNKQLPEIEDGGALIYHSFEGVTALALLFSIAFNPELILKIGHFKGLLAVLATRAAWVSFRTIASEMPTK